MRRGEPPPLVRVWWPMNCCLRGRWQPGEKQRSCLERQSSVGDGMLPRQQTLLETEAFLPRPWSMYVRY